ncbi:putative ABC transporter, periplasmic component YrbD [Dissulfuribacter thermophilus]|uniref:Putative ABC transporter, periplasmic component YrbD n=1 Tax=Dissulfuribacter thermophilus TaxID=1156395 RepID=A0A1B9F5C5_9BACT|nr:outer membrane lipid asymmetry maintenance protein MlaD [Dissulfuribacter thermophilus]OCC15110.1 putative ABC transporter, periplasmic component YrbD [Dissulfuribacter thermophilus]
MNRYKIETAVGLFVFIGIVCIAYLTIKLGKMELIGSNYYIVYAQFDSVSGLKKDSNVEIAGVPVGRVSSIKLDPKEKIAIVGLKIAKDIKLEDDCIASIKTRGLIGDKFVKIIPGGSDTFLKPGDTIVDTESAVDIEDLIGKYVFGNVDNTNDKELQ